MRAALAGVLYAGLVSTAAADTFGGFSGVDRPYLVNSDRVCTPLAVTEHASTGAPKCDKLGADVIAKLSIKPPIVQSGAKASFAATASGTTLTVTRKTGETLVTWTAPDPIGKIVDVYGSQYDDRVAVAYTVRRLGKEVTDVIAFDLGQAQTAVVPPKDPHDPKGTPPPVTPQPVEDPQVVKAVAAAKAAPKAKAIAAWKAVLAVDSGHSEALYRLAGLQLGGKQKQDALDALGSLASSPRPDAIEWLVDARFDAAFASLRADPKFRAIVGLDKPPTTTYERLMGFGGQWEQTGTSCDKPEVHLVASRDRTVKLRVKTACEGQVFDTPFKGVWRMDGDALVLTFARKGQAVTANDEAPCDFRAVGDENALHCVLGRDLDFALLPTRR
jgi:hypothetical protein